MILNELRPTRLVSSFTQTFRTPRRAARAGNRRRGVGANPGS